MPDSPHAGPPDRSRGRPGRVCLERYPFDTQQLKIEIEDSVDDTRDFVYVPDDDPVEISKDLTIPGWDVGEPALEIIDNKYATNFGDPTADNLTFSRAVFELPVAVDRRSILLLTVLYFAVASVLFITSLT